MGEPGQWLADFRWAMNAMRVRRHRRRLGFMERERFDNLLRPIIGEEGHRAIIAYPDALYHVRDCDVSRAILYVPHP